MVESLPEIYFQWDDIRFSVEIPKLASKDDGSVQRKVILDGLSGIVRPGQLCAILGSSGSGKTSLLNIIAQRNKSQNISGNVLVNGEAPPKSFTRLSGYVRQDPMFFETLTVRESLIYTAKLRLPYKMPFSKKLSRVDQLIHELDLTKCANSFIGKIGAGISGGERRRLAVAMELINNPKVLFLDEPTSGLDSASALRVVRILKQLAVNDKRTIFCTIHQPRASMLPYFDLILLLAEGKTVYFGPSIPTVTDYFVDAGFPCPQFENPADFMLDLINTMDVEEQESSADTELLKISGHSYENAPSKSEPNAKETMSRAEVISHLVDHFRSTGAMETIKHQTDEELEKMIPLSTIFSDNSELVKKYPTPFYYQFIVLFSRSFFHKLREPAAVMSQAVYSIVLPLIVGSIFWQIGFDQNSIFDRASGIAFIVLLQTFMAFDIILLFPIERRIYLEEHSAGLYSTSAFFWGRSLADSPFHVIFSATVAIISYWMFGLQANAQKFFTYLVIIEMVTLCGTSALLLCGAIAKDMEQANILATVLLIVFTLFTGTYVNKNNIPSYYRWLNNLSFIGFASEAAIKNEFVGISFTCLEGQTCAYEKGEDYLAVLGLQDVNTWSNIGIIFAMILVYRLLAYLGLKFLHTGKSIREILKE